MSGKRPQQKECNSFETYLEAYYPEASSTNKLANNMQPTQLGVDLADQALSEFRQVFSKIKVRSKSKRQVK